MTTYDLAFLGGGQLARMSIMAAQRMGLRCVSLDPGVDTPAARVAPNVVGRLDDPESLAHVLRQSGAATLENEFLPADALRAALELAGFDEARLVPGIETLATVQDKLRQREAYAAAGVPSPRAVGFGSVEELEAALPYPVVLKARFGGYDGKGTAYARSREELEALRPRWGDGGWLAEEWVPFRREVAVMVAVSADGEARCFPTVETRQVDSVCDLVVPFAGDAAAVAAAAVRAVRGRGLFGVELFETAEGGFLVNEIAPRPHNTGHYTLDWGGPSQFEVHARLTMRLPLPRLEGRPAAMANLLGVEGAGDWRRGLRAALEAEPEARVHWYGKAESRPGRKMGHVNASGDDAEGTVVRAREAFLAAWRD